VTDLAQQTAPAQPRTSRPTSARFNEIARQARLATGLILFAFVLTHLLNHALGLISVDLMERVQQWRMAVTRHPAGTAMLYGSLGVHMVLALARTASRHCLRLPKLEIVQLLLGIGIPLLLLLHLADTRLSNWLSGFNDRYRDTIPGYWPDNTWLLLLMVVVVWVHACIGMHFWLLQRRWYRRSFLLWFTLATMIPALALAGFAAAGQSIKAEKTIKRLERKQSAAIEMPLLQQASFHIALPERTAERPRPVLAAQPSGPGKAKKWSYDEVKEIATIGQWMYAAFAALALMTPIVAFLYRRRGPKVMVSYPGTRRITAPRGSSLLEISRNNRIPHTSVCGGRGRCSTCRVQLARESDPQPQPNSIEAKLLHRIKAPADVRLACQLKPVGRLAVTPLVPAGDAQNQIQRFEPRGALGVEREIVVMFSDLRGFTTLSEHRLPYDTVFLLNEYFAGQEAVIRKHGGRVDKYMGDGIMALFGTERIFAEGENAESDLESACRSALAALADMQDALDAMNSDDRITLEQPLRIAIGLHVGQAVLGEIGAGRARQQTAIGDVVNAAARLESLAKEWNVPAVASVDVLKYAGWGVEGFEPMSVDIRGKKNSVEVVRLEDPRALTS
jgi:adenylate cyclase